MSSSLENEDLDNGPLVRMEDVQPVKTRSLDVVLGETEKDEEFETCIISNIDYDNECVVDDDDSNIGSMVSIHSEEVVGCDDNGEEFILPEILPAQEVDIQAPIKPKIENKSPPDGWPTLEILPGGVIKHSEKVEDDLGTLYGQNTAKTEPPESGEMMYACAKCSESFKYLYCLVKHVRWHEKEQKMQKGPNLAKLTSLEKELVFVKRARLELERNYKKQKVEVINRIATAIGKIENVEDFFTK